MRSFAKIKPSRKCPDLQHLTLLPHCTKIVKGYTKDAVVLSCHPFGVNLHLISYLNSLRPTFLQ